MEANVPPVDHPPAGCWEEVDRAARLARDFELTGIEIHFERPAPGQRVSIAMRRRGRANGRRLTPSEVLALAVGESSQGTGRSTRRPA
jgi:hypothetical protein